MKKKSRPLSFAEKVWKAACEIPLGEVRTYAWVARKIGQPKAARAVGQALKKNPYPIIVPCHRVVSSNGALGGYALGERKKKLLLRLEKTIAGRLSL